MEASDCVGRGHIPHVSYQVDACMVSTFEQNMTAPHAMYKTDLTFPLAIPAFCPPVPGSSEPEMGSPNDDRPDSVDF